MSNWVNSMEQLHSRLLDKINEVNALSLPNRITGGIKKRSELQSEVATCNRRRRQEQERYKNELLYYKSELGKYKPTTDSKDDSEVSSGYGDDWVY